MRWDRERSLYDIGRASRAIWGGASVPAKERIVIGVGLALAALVLGNVAYAVWIRLTS